MLPLHYSAHRRTAALAITPRTYHPPVCPVDPAFPMSLNPLPSPTSSFLIATLQNAEFRATHRKQKVATKSNRYFWTFFCPFVSSSPKPLRTPAGKLSSCAPSNQFQSEFAKFARFSAPGLCPIPGRMIPMTGQDGPTPPLQCASKRNNINALSLSQHRNSICDTYSRGWYPWT